MKDRIIVNFALIFGALGFLGFLLMIFAGFFGCCAGLTAGTFNNIILGTFIVSFLGFAWCMYNNCCRATRREKEDS